MVKFFIIIEFHVLIYETASANQSLSLHDVIVAYKSTAKLISPLPGGMLFPNSSTKGVATAPTPLRSTQSSL